MRSPRSSGWDGRTAPLNLARVFFKEGRLDEAASALRRAAAAGAPPWTVAWLSGLVNKENGFLDQAIEDFERVLATGPAEVGARRFDFSVDYEVINELGQALFERAKLERGAVSATSGAGSFLQRAAEQFEKTLRIDSENVTAHYVLSLDLRSARRSRARRRTRRAACALQTRRQRARPRDRHASAGERRRQPRRAIDRHLPAALMRASRSIGGFWSWWPSWRVAGGRRLDAPLAHTPAPAAPLPVAAPRRRSHRPAAAFVDITRQAGITFEHENGAEGQKLLPETMGGGVAFFDFDNDGRPDLLFVDSRPWPWSAPRRPHAAVAARAVSQRRRRTLRRRRPQPPA